MTTHNEKDQLVKKAIVSMSMVGFSYSQLIIIMNGYNLLILSSPFLTLN